MSQGQAPFHTMPYVLLYSNMGLSKHSAQWTSLTETETTADSQAVIWFVP
jgi:hypothetical protein